MDEGTSTCLSSTVAVPGWVLPPAENKCLPNEVLCADLTCAVDAASCDSKLRTADVVQTTISTSCATGQRELSLAASDGKSAARLVVSSGVFPTCDVVPVQVKPVAESEVSVITLKVDWTRTDVFGEILRYSDMCLSALVRVHAGTDIKDSGRRRLATGGSPAAPLPTKVEFQFRVDFVPQGHPQTPEKDLCLAFVNATNEWECIDTELAFIERNVYRGYSPHMNGIYGIILHPFHDPAGPGPAPGPAPGPVTPPVTPVTKVKIETTFTFTGLTVADVSDPAGNAAIVLALETVLKLPSGSVKILSTKAARRRRRRRLLTTGGVEIVFEITGEPAAVTTASTQISTATAANKAAFAKAVQAGMAAAIPSKTFDSVTLEVTKNPTAPVPVPSREVKAGSTKLDAALTMAWEAAGADKIKFTVTLASKQAWVSIGFSSNGGQMVGSDAVIGRPDLLSAVAGGGVQTTLPVQEYELKGKSVDLVTPFPAAAASIEATTLESTAAGGTTMSFTTPFKVGNQAIPRSGPADVIYAYGPTPPSADQPPAWTIHAQRGIQRVNFATAEATKVAVAADPLHLVHGALMTLAWAGMIPFGISAVRHYRPISPPGSAWYRRHRALQVVAVLLATVALVLGFVMMGTTPHFSKPHHLVGLMVMVLGYLQPLVAFLRPHKPEEGKGASLLRVIWQALHIGFGYITALGGLANVVLGILLMAEFGPSPQAAAYYGLGGFAGVCVVANVAYAVPLRTCLAAGAAGRGEGAGGGGNKVENLRKSDGPNVSFHPRGQKHASPGGFAKMRENPTFDQTHAPGGY